ncbi:MAG: hypothetical protein C0621_01905 [Desulfuromonas sp.]|nr:MAG: hypothetical protein C0621_01905 [Desulfuromonas sp.]
MKNIKINDNLLVETNEILKKYGNNGFEGLVLWFGTVTKGSAFIEEIFTPPQKSIKSEYGVGYLVSGETLFSINKYLHKTGLRLVAQVHSHPSRAYHSETDDRLAVATKEGSFSLVVPDFATGPANLHRWAVYQLRRGQWEEVSSKDKDRFFTILKSDIEGIKPLKHRWWKWIWK